MSYDAPVVVAAGKPSKSGKARLLQVSTQEFAVWGEPTLKVGDKVLLSKLPPSEAYPSESIWAAAAEE